jgi:hypothetical protein
MKIKFRLKIIEVYPALEADICGTKTRLNVTAGRIWATVGCLQADKFLET